MKKILSGTLLLGLLLATAALAADQERWLHVSVKKTAPHNENVLVNVPLSLAEKVLPAINVHRLRNGKLMVHHRAMDHVDLRALLEAVRTTRDSEFVTVQSDHQNVRVAKAGGYLLVNVRESRSKKHPREGEPAKPEAPKTVDVRIPFPVVEALLSGDKNELNILAAVRALSAHGDIVLVTVNDKSESARIWIDSKNTGE